MRRLLPQSEKSLFIAGKLSIDLAQHSVEVNGHPVHLTPTEYALLKVLVLIAGKIMTHGQILKEIWDKTEDVEEALHLLRVTMSNLRNKIEPDPDMPAYIITEPCVGYRLCTDG